MWHQISPAYRCCQIQKHVSSQYVKNLDWRYSSFRFNAKRKLPKKQKWLQGIDLCRNIKHAFFQPAENEMITLVHFHLHDPIMVGKKKTQDVQFYTEVMEAVQTLDGGRRSMYDPDEIEEEQRERAMRHKVYTARLNLVIAEFKRVHCKRKACWRTRRQTACRFFSCMKSL